jgi:predicted DNA-binding transcriptional regulator AlpA
MTIHYTINQASEYTGVPVKFIRNQIKHGQGPKYISPSPRIKFFTQSALDEWMATWVDHVRTKDAAVA